MKLLLLVAFVTYLNVCHGKLHFYAFQPEYPGQFDNLTITELKHVINGDVRAVKSMMARAAQHYPQQGLTPAQHFYSAVVRFIDENMSRAYDYIDRLDNSTVRHRTYVQFAQHTRKCRDIGSVEENKRSITRMDVRASEEQLKNEFTQIYNRSINLLKSAIEFEKRYDIAFWPEFHQSVSKRKRLSETTSVSLEIIDFMSPQLPIITREIDDLATSERKKGNYKLLHDDLYLLLVSFLGKDISF